MKTLRNMPANAHSLQVHIQMLIVAAFMVGSAFINMITFDQVRHQMNALMMQNQESDIMRLAQDIEREVSQRKQVLEWWFERTCLWNMRSAKVS